MKHFTFPIAIIFLALATVTGIAQEHSTTTAASTPQDQVTRDATREKLRSVLNAYGPKVNVTFRQNERNPYNFVGVMEGLKNSDSFEIVITVSSQETIHFRIYPHYKGGYINVDRVRNSLTLMRTMLVFGDKNFIYWGADDSGDVFAGYNFTLESGFPTASINVVLNSIKNLDQYVGQLRPSIDGSAGL